MEFKVFGSGSSGNMYVLKSTSGQRLILDVGFSYAEVLKAVDYEIENTWIVFSHSHGDHFKGVKGCLENGLSVYSSSEIHESVGTHTHRRSRFIEVMQPVEIGEFTVLAFDVKHDVPCLGFLIRHPECGLVCYMTDTTYIDIAFEGVNHYLIEANFCEDVVTDKVYDQKLDVFRGQRILDHHLSIQNCSKILLSQDLSSCENIVLLHLSDANSHEVKFRNRIIKETGKQVFVARPGLTINFDLDPF